MIARWPKLTGLITGHQTPLVEWQPPNWVIWISYDKTVQAGTYLVLQPGGRIMRHTTAPTGEVTNVVTIKP